MSERLTDGQLNQIESAANGMDSWVYGVTVKDLINDLRHYKKLAEERGAALELYADKSNWELPSFGRGHSPVTSDRGERARQALGKEQQP